ncbi:MAG: ATP-binding protein [Desulfobulbaceae bacterium]|nr:ATP-binding protein [Desulfobulbaceae bacterium]
MGIIKDAIMKGPGKITALPPSEKSVLTCSKHGEYEGAITKIDRKEIRDICPECLQEEIENDRAEREEIMKVSIAKARIKGIFKRSSFPKIFSNVSFDDYRPNTKEATEVLRRMKNYASRFADVREVGSSVVFIGGTGTGKSMLSAAIGNEVMNQGYTVLYITCPQAISLIKRSWAKNSEISQDEYLEKFSKPDLLILDEVPKGCKSLADWELIHEIMNRRYMNQKPTISISTLTEDNLKEKMTEEIFRRMSYKGDTMRFTWKKHEEIGVLW